MNFSPAPSKEKTPRNRGVFSGYQDNLVKDVLGSQARVATCVVVQTRRITLLHRGAGVGARIVRRWLVKHVGNVQAQLQVLDAVVHVAHVKGFP